MQIRAPVTSPSRAPVQRPAKLLRPPPFAHERIEPSRATGATLLVRPRLQLGARDDPAERQADRIVALALRGPSTESTPRAAGSAHTAQPSTTTESAAPMGVRHAPTNHAVANVDRARSPERRSPAHAEHDADRARDPLLERELARPEAGDGGLALSLPLEQRVLALHAGGVPLPDCVRADMEARFGVDFGAVRIHADAGGNVLAEQLHAHAFTAGDHIVFNRGAFEPTSAGGRRLLAHELAHVAQQRPQARDASPPAASPSNETRLRRDTQEEQGIVASLFNAAGEFIADQGWQLVRRYAPSLEPMLREGPANWLRGQLARAFDGIVATLTRLNPVAALDTLTSVFGALITRAGTIIAALASGDCGPLLAAIGELKAFISDVATAAWDKLSELLTPIGDFFSNLWSGYGAPAVQWLQEFAGDVWEWITQLGRDIWDWTQPVRDDIGAAWDWIKTQLFGSDDASAADSSGGIIGWITDKAGEAWDWLKEQTRPVWEPVADAAQTIAELIPPPFVRDMAASMQGLSAELEQTAGQLEQGSGGRSIADNRQALAAALPSVQRIIVTVRRVLVDAGAWLVEKLATFGDGIAAMIGRLRANALLSLLVASLGWLEAAAQRLLAWARDQVGAVFAFVLQGFDRLTPFFETVLNTVQRLIGVVGDLLQLPQLVLNAVWQLIPQCFRDPIKDFLINQILGRIPIFGQFFTDPELWPRVQQTALEILRQIFVDGDIPRAAWTYFQAVLRLLGLPPELVVRLLAKAAQAFGDIMANPIGFIVNVLRTIYGGFRRFFDNIGTHLLNGVAGWLFHSVRDLGLQPPSDLSFGSILRFVLQVLGITVENVFRRLATRIGQAAVDRLRGMLDLATGVWSFVVLAIKDPAGLWRELSERLSTLWTTVVESAISWVSSRLIVNALLWLASFADISFITPAINTLIAIYRAVQAAIEYAKDMIRIVGSIFDGIVDIAHGTIETAAGYFEKVLADALPVAIGFTAYLLGVGRISNRIQEILGSVRERVDSAIDWLIDRAIRGGQALLDLAKRGVAAVRNWWQARVSFRASNGQGHEMYFRGEGRSADLIVESDPEPFRDFIARQPNSDDKTEALRLYNLLRQKQDQAVAAGSASGGARHSAAAPTTPASTDLAAEIKGLMDQLALVTARLMGGATGAGEPPAWGPTNSQQFGTDVSVPTMTPAAVKAWPDGTGPSVTSAPWERLLKRRNDRTGNSSYYVRGHLLNHNIGGPGDKWSNLTPLAQESNNRGGQESMLGRFETPVKKAVDAGSTIRNFHVRPNYGSPNRGAQLSKIDAEIAIEQKKSAGTRVAPDLTIVKLGAIRDVIDEEQHIPASISCSALIEAKNGTRETINEVIDNTPTLASGDEWTQYQVNP